MRCRKAQALIVARDAGHPLADRESPLRRHLADCPVCRLAAREDERVVAELRALRGTIPYTIDVKRRVMAELDALGAVSRHELSVRELALATMTALSGLIGLGVAIWLSWPGWTAAGGALSVVIGALDGLFSGAWTVLRAALTIPFKLLLIVGDAAGSLAFLVADLRSAALIAIAACYVIMGLTIVHFVGRDLRPAGTIHTSGD